MADKPRGRPMADSLPARLVIDRLDVIAAAVACIPDLVARMRDLERLQSTTINRLVSDRNAADRELIVLGEKIARRMARRFGSAESIRVRDERLDAEEANGGLSSGESTGPLTPFQLSCRNTLKALHTVVPDAADPTGEDEWLQLLAAWDRDGLDGIVVWDRGRAYRTAGIYGPAVGSTETASAFDSSQPVDLARMSERRDDAFHHPTHHSGDGDRVATEAARPSVDRGVGAELDQADEDRGQAAAGQPATRVRRGAGIPGTPPIEDRPAISSPLAGTQQISGSPKRISDVAHGEIPLAGNVPDELPLGPVPVLPEDDGEVPAGEDGKPDEDESGEVVSSGDLLAELRAEAMGLEASAESAEAEAREARRAAVAAVSEMVEAARTGLTSSGSGEQLSGVAAEAALGEWRRRVSVWSRTGLWRQEWGGAPGQPGCVVPAGLLGRR